MARLCKEVLKRDPFGGWVFVFRNRPAKALKILVWRHPQPQRREQGAFRA